MAASLDQSRNRPLLDAFEVPSRIHEVFCDIRQSTRGSQCWEGSRFNEVCAIVTKMNADLMTDESLSSFSFDSLPWLPILYLANFLWFLAAFVQFTFKPRNAFVAGTRDAYMQEGRIVNSPLDKANPPASCHKVRGDAYHYDLFMYLGAMNGAMAVFVLSQMLCQPQRIWEQHEMWAELQRLCLAFWGTSHMSQSLVGWGRIWRSGRWRWGGLLGLRTITIVDTSLWAADWAVAWHG